MPWFKIYAGLGGSFGGARYDHTEEFADEDDAMEAAYDAACQIYESYEGLYGLRTVSDIMEEDGVDWETAEETYCEEREGWIAYHVKEGNGPDDTDD